MPRTPLRPVTGALAAGALTLGACASAADDAGPAASPTPPAAAASAPPPSPRTSLPSTARGGADCAADVVDGLTSQQRAGQLLMTALDAGAPVDSLDELVADRHLGGVLLLSGWRDGAGPVRAATGHVSGLASPEATAGLGLLVAADQEGGAVQQLQGEGFAPIPSAREQNSRTPAQLREEATAWGADLARAGINVNLAPVADTVPGSLGAQNQPIGRFGRQYSSDPGRNADMVAAFAAGMRAAGVAATVKHFPGIGRITGNTDLSASGVVDDTTTADDPYLEPFARAADEDVELVMVGSATYPKIDPDAPAVFSERIVTDLLRGELGYDGVVISDDVGVAESVAQVPPGERATRFVEAGGDIVLTASRDAVPVMHDALTSRSAADPAFAAKVEASATRVVALKVRLGLASCP